jgi:hypothetical protein
MVPGDRVAWRMTRFLPVGPAFVGLEATVLPSRAVVIPEPGGGHLELTAPECRYGVACYRITLHYEPPVTGWRGATVLYQSDLVAGGDGSRLELVDEDVTVTRAVLEIVEFTPDIGAMAAMTEAERLDALAHPIEEVRLAAVMAM